ncbi:HAD hydrolase-like protein [Fundicoccus culcitae]|uniref:HAD hydrolase-like protein n=1 Tax=Fundicoccus culcitae TaxID=2969821 RepID=A0ABY5P3Z4_9LACT|nr:HAD hydrolase-like protein [Fundicoccus culcitae]UUX33394.1 HAD hydrolase-like protein [Fundicoccus culcitae]
MQKQNIFFDLDGTLIDSSPGIFSGISYALKKMQREDIDVDVKRHFIGPPLQHSFEQLDMTASEATQAIGFYREYYSDAGLMELSVYEGIPEVLAHLAQTHTLYIATSKPETFAQKILLQLDLSQYFTAIYGASLDGVRASKDDVLAYAVGAAGLTDVTASVMIGDRKHDILGAAHLGMDSIGVLYGFGSLDELSAAGATAIVASPSDLLELLER